ncbi:SusC/RagA family TonB-linked outer membrane protein [Spirosoma endophyticum]|uniref:TonB-linked outer membrane protein, SusC/RagA family n=1 Tax=Spirosoma endophyticum TaxID=662367 RepID=A0A1I1W719_9BACT|nr:SusC/RagA family TonB-linked outer membrane protein [Spirosoma endophyticum]SFD90937.1 TonB-linked outer membrane protein, SusC/RagA family [Spirosoma endophyticum]
MIRLIRTTRFRLVGLGLLLGYPHVPYGQVLAYHRDQITESKQSATNRLRDVLLDMQSRYRINIVFDEKLLEGITVDTRKLSPSMTITNRLRYLLEGSGLRYVQTQKDTYLIVPDRPVEKASDSKSVPDDKSAAITPLPGMPVSVNQPTFVVDPSVRQTVSGRVTDENGAGLPGVNVSEQGTTNGTTTDAEGKFRLLVDGTNSVLVFSFLGYQTLTRSVGTGTAFNVRLQPDVRSLSEVVVIGYGERQRKDLTGAVSVVGGDELVKNKALNPELAMQGRLPGVFVSTPGGAPNARPTVRIRGVNTLGYNDPLYVVDGVPITEYGSGPPQSGNAAQATDLRGNVNILNMINPNDIESISVLKDASSAAIYGVRAANGVVLITTKRGKVGRPRLELSASRGIQNLPKRYDVLDVPDYVALVREMYANNPAQAANLPAIYKDGNAAYLGNLPRTDWQSALINKNAVTEDYSAKVSGGSESTTYYVSGGYSRTESPLQQNNFKRYSLALNLTSKVNRWLEVGLTNRLSYVDALDNTQSDLSSAWRYAPWQPIYAQAGFPAYDGFAQTVNPTFAVNPAFDPTKISLGGGPYTITNTGLLYGTATRGNVLGQWDTRTNNYSMLRTLGSAYIQVEPLKGLKIKGTLSADWYITTRNQWQSVDSYRFSSPFTNTFSATNGTSKGQITQRILRNYNLVKEFSVNYNHAFGGHSVDLLFNAMDQQYGASSTGAANTQINYYNPDALALLNTAPYSTGQIIPENNALQGYLGRLSYNYKSKYYVDATVRRDGTSRFDKDYRWGTFPSLAVAWRITAEPFMKNVTWLSDLKMRAGVGEIGNQETTQFAYLSLVNFNPDYSYGSGVNGEAIGSLQNGIRLANIPVRNLSWERVQTRNIGFDASLLENRITATIEYYDKKTSGILQTVTLPTSAGIDDGSAPTNNIASVRNNGFEFQLAYTGKVGNNLTYNVSGNLTTVRNQVTGLYRDLAFTSGNNRTEINQPIGYLYGYKFGGIFQNQGEIDAYKATKPTAAAAKDAINSDRVVPGDAYFQDTNGDGIVNANDRVYLGKTILGYYYGFNLGAAYKGIDVSIFFQGVGDVQAINAERQAGIGMNSENINYWTDVRNRWTPTNPSTTLPRAVQGDPASNNRFSDRFVENSSFMRLKNLQVGYALPRVLLDRLSGLSGVRIYVTGNNLLTFTGWKGLDPENDAIPPARSWILGLNVNF